jgi:hypothetical protein
METTMSHEEILLGFAEGILDKNHGIPGTASTYFGFSREKINRVPMEKSHPRETDIALHHRKKVFLVEQTIRKELCKSANEVGMLKEGKPVESHPEHTLQMICHEGKLHTLKEGRHVIIDPLMERDFLYCLRARI